MILVSMRKVFFSWRAVLSTYHITHNMRKISTNLCISLIAQVINLIVGFVLPRLILEQFGSDVNGLTQSIKQFLGIICFMDMGLGQVVRSALYKPLHDKDYPQISRVLSSGRKFYRRIAYMLLLYVSILLLVYPLLIDYNFSWLYIAVLIGAMAISTFAQFYFGIIDEQLLHADQKSYIIYGVQIATNLINLAIVACLVNLNSSIQTVKLATSIIFLLKPLIYSTYIKKHYTIDRNIKFTEEPIAHKWSGIAQHVSAVVLSGTDNIVLTIFSTLSNVSVYSVYYMVISSIQTFHHSATVGIQSAAGGVWATRDKEKIMRFFFMTEVALHAMTVFLFSCTGVLIIPFVQVYTEGLPDSNYIQPFFAILLVLAYAVFCMRTPYNIWILAAGHFRQTKKCHITAAVLNLSISMIAVSRWGLIGIAVGTLIAMCYQTTWMAFYTTRNLVRCSMGHILKQCFADTVAVATICITTSCIKLNDVSYIGWFFMAVKVATIAFVCIVCTSVVFYRKEALQVIRRMFRKVA